MLTGALNQHLDLQRFEVLYICGRSRAAWTARSPPQVRRANTLLQLMTVLDESCHSLLIIEHDPLLYMDAEENGGVYLAGHEGGGQGEGQRLRCGLLPRAVEKRRMKQARPPWRPSDGPQL
jgi:hypothetical protein